MTFTLDPRISSSCFKLADWPLCQILLKDNTDYPWIILVPRQNNIREIFELSKAEQYQLMEEIARISSVMNAIFNPDKLNVGALGNIVSQLHIHVIGRYTHDSLWPHSVWQEALTQRPYDPEQLQSLLKDLRLALN